MADNGTEDEVNCGAGTDTAVFDLGIDDVDDGDACEDLDPVTQT